MRRKRGGGAYERALKSFANLAARRNIYMGGRFRIAAERAEGNRLVHHCASWRWREGLPVHLCRLPWRETARRHGACADRQAILAELRGEKSFDVVVRCAYHDADVRARLGFRKEIGGYHGIPFAEKWRTRRQHAARRYDGLDQGAPSEIVDCFRVRRSETYRPLRDARLGIDQHGIDQHTM